MLRNSKHIICICLSFLIQLNTLSQIGQNNKSLTIKYPQSDGITLMKILKGFMLCDTSGELKKPGSLIFDGSILFDYGQWNSSGLPVVFRVWDFEYIDKNGNLIASNHNNEFTNAYPFRNGFAIVQKGNRYNFINKNGNLIGTHWFDYADDFSQNMAIVGEGKWNNNFFTGKVGFIDTLQNITIPMKFEAAENFSNGAARVCIQGKVFQINSSGKPINKDKSLAEIGFSMFTNPVAKLLLRPEEKDFSRFTFVFAIDSAAMPEASNNGWDFKNKKGTILLHLNYDYALKFSEGFAPVKKIGKWNYVDEKGNLLLSEWVEDVENFKQGIAKVKKDGKAGFIDHSGRLIIPMMYPVKSFSGGRACIERAGSRDKEVTFIDKSGNRIIDWMAAASMFVNGLAEIKREDGLYATIDTSGNIISTWHYRVLFSGDLVDVLECNNLFTLREKNGHITYEWMPDTKLFSEGLLAIKKSGVSGFIDKYGKMMIQFGYDECWNFQDALALVKKNNRFTWIDKNNRNIANDWFDAVGNFSENLVAVMKKNRWGYMNYKGEIVIKPQYQAAASFSEKFALVEKGNKYGYISKTGKKLTNFDFTAGGNFSNGTALVKKGKISGYIDRFGIFYIKPNQ